MGSIEVKAVLNGRMVVCMMLCAFSFQLAKGQTFSEWFSQGKTQIKYLNQQIAALQAFESSMKQDYAMLHNEWTAIGNFKNGEFGLHQDYYNSLSAVNPQVSASVDLADIQAEQQSINSQFNAIKNLNGLQANERAYISSVRQNIMNQCSKDLDDLQAVLTAGQLQLTDHERIKRINLITAAMKDEYVFTCSFVSQVKVLTLQRNRETQSINTLNRVYETHE